MLPSAFTLSSLRNEASREMPRDVCQCLIGQSDALQWRIDTTQHDSARKPFLSSRWRILLSASHDYTGSHNYQQSEFFSCHLCRLVSVDAELSTNGINRATGGKCQMSHTPIVLPRTCMDLRMDRGKMGLAYIGRILFFSQKGYHQEQA
jgi:hypothetical protein